MYILNEVLDRLAEKGSILLRERISICRREIGNLFCAFRLFTLASEVSVYTSLEAVW